jgi:SAM-dependent methyltransferase
MASRECEDSEQALAQVRAAYDHDPDREWRRLESGVPNRIELLVTCHALRRHLPPPAAGGRVLDAGGGPGRYSLLLAEWGYRPTLFDLSPRLLAHARRQFAIAERQTGERIEAALEGSITDLARFPDGHFDAVLCLGGPLSHLVEDGQRRRAVAELARVGRPGAPIFLSAMNRLGVFRAMVQQRIYRGDLRELWKTGRSEIRLGAEPAPAYFFTPEEFVDLLEAGGLEAVRLYGCAGIAAHLPSEHLAALMADTQRWPVWQEVLLATCDHPNVVGASSHLLAVARRQAQHVT